MSWIEQGRQQHGRFGHGTAAQVSASKLRAWAFAVADLAADDFSSRDTLPFPVDKTRDVLWTFASFMAPRAGLPPNDFRLRFFRASFDPVESLQAGRARNATDGQDHRGIVNV